MRIPFELIQYKQWVLWRKTEVNGRVTKVSPYLTMDRQSRRF